eukprot:CAMPEP_0204864368 /NCGR_PEP_ID=MMETSP1348-20121228/4016_1 /ASSEMBLY_ACC=CAM_ASM_000700 /TAXON_ID=215587 /ORGANISM="Aplanochytrium stocchinoi, Strain GSBS06" /LENGTH=477 /DNA_ID=CAMNT_0052014987 /DNA_START=81 /DNA_END=1514 /DNA_ORIENTATION=-
MLHKVEMEEVDSSSKALLSKTQSEMLEKTNTCVSSYMLTLKDAIEKGPAFGLTGAYTYFIRLPIRFDVKRLQGELKVLEMDTGWGYRSDVNNYYILLVNRNGVIDDETTMGPFVPVESRLAKTPYLREVLDTFGSLVGRSRFMKLNANTSLTRHRDRCSHISKVTNEPDALSGYWGRRFRVHIPIISDPRVMFHAGNVKIHMEEGYAYLFDNADPHKVENPSEIDRIHLIFDTIGSVELFKLIENSIIVDTQGLERPYKYKSNGVSSSSRLHSSFKIPLLPFLEDSNIVNIFENFTDAEVFEPMDPFDVSSYLLEYLLRMIPPRHAKYHDIKTLFIEFIQEWRERCYKPWGKVAQKSRIRSWKHSSRKIHPELRHAQVFCKDIASNFLISVLQTDVCSADADTDSIKLFPGYPKAQVARSLSLSTVVETFSRMLFYECTGLYEDADIRGPPCISGAPSVVAQRVEDYFFEEQQQQDL